MYKRRKNWHDKGQKEESEMYNWNVKAQNELKFEEHAKVAKKAWGKTHKKTQQQKRMDKIVMD